MLHQKCDKYVDYVLDELFRIENQSFTNLTMECSFVPEFENASWSWIDPITNLTRSLKPSFGQRRPQVKKQSLTVKKIYFIRNIYYLIQSMIILALYLFAILFSIFINSYDLPLCLKQCPGNPFSRSDVKSNWTGLVSN